MTKKIKSVAMVFDKNAFAIDIVNAREDVGMNVNQMAQVIGIADSTLSKYEQGNESNPKIGNMLDVCNAYDLDPRKYFVLSE